MTSIYDDYGERARERLKSNFDPENINRDIGYAMRDLQDIQKFIIAAKEQIAVIQNTAFKRYIEVRKGKDSYLGKVEFSISVYRIPQVPGNEDRNMRVYERDDSQRFVGNDKKKEFLKFVSIRQEKYPDAELVGNYSGEIKPVLGVIQI